METGITRTAIAAVRPLSLPRRAPVLLRPLSTAPAPRPGVPGLQQGKGPPHAKGPEPPPSLAALTLKLTSRLFQRAVTPEQVLEHSPFKQHDLGADPAARKIAGFVEGQVKGRTYDRAKQAILTRLASGFGIILPGIGVYFMGRGVVGSSKRVREESDKPDRSANERQAAVGAFAVATAADAVNFVSNVGGFLKAVHDSTFHLPGLDRHLLSTWSESLGLPAHWTLGLAVTSTAAAAAGEVWGRYPSVRAFMHDKTPSAAVEMEGIVRDVSAGHVDVTTSAGAAAAMERALQAANKAVEEGLPDLTGQAQTRVGAKLSSTGAGGGVTPSVANGIGEAAPEVLGVPTARAARLVAEKAREAALELEAVARQKEQEDRRAAVASATASDEQGVPAEHQGSHQVVQDAGSIAEGPAAVDDQQHTVAPGYTEGPPQPVPAAGDGPAAAPSYGSDAAPSDASEAPASPLPIRARGGHREREARWAQEHPAGQGKARPSKEIKSRVDLPEPSPFDNPGPF